MLLKENSREIESIIEHFINNFTYDRQAVNLLRQPMCTSNESELITTGEYFDFLRKINDKTIQRKSLIRKKFSKALLEYCQDVSLREFKRGRGVSTCLAARKFLVIDSQGVITPCELSSKRLGGLKDQGYDLKGITKSQRSAVMRQEIRASKCYCQWPCAIVSNTLFKPSSY